MLDEQKKLRELLVSFSLVAKPLELVDFFAKHAGTKFLRLADSDLLYESPALAEQSDWQRLQIACRQNRGPFLPPPLWFGIQLFFLPHQFMQKFSSEEVLGSILSFPKELLDPALFLLLRKPKIFLELGETEKYAGYFQAVLDFLAEHIFTAGHPQRLLLARAFLKHHSLSPLYFSRLPLLDVMRKRSDVLAFVLAEDAACGRRPPLSWVVDSRSRGAAERLRLGVFIPKISEKAETIVVLPLLRGIDRKLFSLQVFYLDAASEELLDVFGRLVDEMIRVPEEVSDAVRMLRGKTLDVLLFATNLTQTTGFSAVLASYRLAPVQVADTCSPVTTGLANVDYYLTGSLTDPEGAERFYRETLLRVDGPAQAYAFLGTETSEPFPRWRKKDLQIDEKSILFVSGANCNKIIPETRLLWARILAEVPGSYLLLYPFNRNWQGQYPVAAFLRSLQVFGDSLGVESKRWKVLPEPFTSRAEILSMIACGDIYLDSLNHSGAVSMLDPLLVGLPPVVLEGQLGRARQASAILCSLGLGRYVCRSPEEYATLAVDLALDEKKRKVYADEISLQMAGNPQIFDSGRYARQLESKFLSLFEGKKLGRSRSANV